MFWLMRKQHIQHQNTFIGTSTGAGSCSLTLQGGWQAELAHVQLCTARSFTGVVCSSVGGRATNRHCSNFTLSPLTVGIRFASKLWLINNVIIIRKAVFTGGIVVSGVRQSSVVNGF